MSLDNGLANECSSEKSPKWYQKMTTGYASKVKERIGNLKNANFDNENSFHAHQKCPTEAQAKMPKNPTRSTRRSTPDLRRSSNVCQKNKTDELVSQIEKKKKWRTAVPSAQDVAAWVVGFRIQLVFQYRHSSRDSISSFHAFPYYRESTFELL